MYDMKLKQRFIKRALEMLVEQSQDEMMMIFHRDKILYLDDLMYHWMTSFSIEVVHVTNNDKILDCFASFVAFIQHVVQTLSFWMQILWHIYHSQNQEFERFQIMMFRDSLKKLSLIELVFFFERY